MAQGIGGAVQTLVTFAPFNVRREAKGGIVSKRPVVSGADDLVDEAGDRHLPAALDIHGPLKPVAEHRELLTSRVRRRLLAAGFAHYGQGLRINRALAAPRDGNGKGIDHRAQPVGAGLRIHLDPAAGVRALDARGEERARDGQGEPATFREVVGQPLYRERSSAVPPVALPVTTPPSSTSVGAPVAVQLPLRAYGHVEPHAVADHAQGGLVPGGDVQAQAEKAVSIGGSASTPSTA